jgi:cytochrome c oxidase accessory protein FixG
MEIKPMTSTGEPLYQFDEEFRNSISTVSAKGERVWIFPKKPHGVHHRWRIVVTVLLLSLFFSGPFITINGHPFLLINFLERRFVLFGQVFWPQDFSILAITGITFFVFIILFTVAFGRVWCGWACPQTLFMEMVFRKIEYWIEGNANDQRRLKTSPLTFNKVSRKILKHFLFLVISILIAHTAMAYLIGVDKVKQIISQSPADHLGGFIGLTAFTLIFYWVYASFREQACTVVCPYGRLQGVLLVKDSILVAYDWLRGEPRSRLKKTQSPEEEKKGDCIDCKLCVHVCPTGIDIRHGTQLECVNCTACIDACDEVMVKINKPKGLIRYSSHRAIEEGKLKLFTPRVAGYSAVLMALLGLLSFIISTHQDVEMTVLKVPGTLYAKTDDGQITNLYQIEFINKTFNDIPLELKIESPEGATFMRVGGPTINVPKEGMLKGIYLVKVPPHLLQGTKTEIQLGVYQHGKKIITSKIKFIGPIKKQS